VNRVVGYLLRCAVILCGYAVAALAASAFLHVIFFAWAGFEPKDTPALAMGSFVFSIPFVALFVAYFAFIPSAAVILVAEVLAKRDWLFYALGGGIVAAIFLAFRHQAVGPDFEAASTGPMLAVIGGGIVGGFFYWLSAGRWAGGWHGSKEPPATIAGGS
jgi:hypothetical protein